MTVAFGVVRWRIATGAAVNVPTVHVVHDNTAKLSIGKLISESNSLILIKFVFGSAGRRIIMQDGTERYARARVHSMINNNKSREVM